jgi:tight adherence protein B
MRALTAGLLAAGVVLVTAAPSAAAELPLQIGAVDTHAAPTVSLDVTPPGADEASLPPGAFTVTEDGKEVDAAVDRVSGEELEVVLVIDTSGSMKGAPMDAAKAAAGAFVNRMPAQARIAVVGFGPNAVVASPLGTDRAATHFAINGLAPAGETALYDAVSLATLQFSPAASRRSIVVLSDGADTTSAASPQLVLERVSAAHARVDAAVLQSPESDAGVLATLASAGGGESVEVAGPEALDGVYTDVATRLVSTYRLTWESRAAGATEVEVAVDVAGDTAVGRTTIDLPDAPAPKSGASTPTAPKSDEPAGTPTWALIGGALALFAGLLLGGLLLVGREGIGRRRDRMARLGAASGGPSLSGIGELKERASAAAEDALERRGRRAPLHAALERAGIDLRPGEFFVLAGTAVAVAFLVGSVVAGPLVGLLLAGVTGAGARVLVSVRTSRRTGAFSEQLPNTLQIMAGSLRAGYGLVQAVDAVSQEAPSPTSEEFHRVVLEHRLGRDLTDSLRAMSDRVDTEDLRWVVQAIDIHREIGGDLASILDTVAGTVRERSQLKGQMQALTAEGRLSAYILIALPFVLAGMMKFVNPDYIATLTRGSGLVMAFVGLGLIAVGAVWFRKLCRFAP